MYVTWICPGSSTISRIRSWLEREEGIRRTIKVFEYIERAVVATNLENDTSDALCNIGNLSHRDSAVRLIESI